jgi:hypothetical protein
MTIDMSDPAKPREVGRAFCVSSQLVPFSVRFAEMVA